MDNVDKKAMDMGSDGPDGRGSDMEGTATDNKDDRKPFLPANNDEIKAPLTTKKSTADSTSSDDMFPHPAIILKRVAWYVVLLFMAVIYWTIWIFGRQVEMTLAAKYWNMTTIIRPSQYWWFHILSSIALSILSIFFCATIEHHSKVERNLTLPALVLSLVAPSFVIVFYIGIPWTVSTTWAGLTWLAELAGIELA